MSASGGISAHITSAWIKSIACSVIAIAVAAIITTCCNELQSADDKNEHEANNTAAEILYATVDENRKKEHIKNKNPPTKTAEGFCNLMFFRSARRLGVWRNHKVNHFLHKERSPP